MLSDDLSIAEIETLINRARAAAPSVGSEQSLSADVSLLGALYGRMIFRGVAAVPLAHLSERQRSAIGRWRLPDEDEEPRPAGG